MKSKIIVKTLRATSLAIVILVCAAPAQLLKSTRTDSTIVARVETVMEITINPYTREVTYHLPSGVQMRIAPNTAAWRDLVSNLRKLYIAGKKPGETVDTTTVP